MCAINPKRQAHFTVSIYTSLDMDESEFMNLVGNKLVELEAELNRDMRLRWHVSESPVPAARAKRKQ